MQVIANHDVLTHHLADEKEKMVAHIESLQTQVDQLTQCLAQSYSYEFELSESEKALKEHCTALER